MAEANDGDHSARIGQLQPSLLCFFCNIMSLYSSCFSLLGYKMSWNSFAEACVANSRSKESPSGCFPENHRQLNKTFHSFHLFSGAAWACRRVSSRRRRSGECRPGGDSWRDASEKAKATCHCAGAPSSIDFSRQSFSDPSIRPIINPNQKPTFK